MNMKNLPGWTSSNFLSFGFLFAFLFIYYLLGWFMVGTSLIVCCISMNLYFASFLFLKYEALYLVFICSGSCQVSRDFIYGSIVCYKAIRIKWIDCPWSDNILTTC